MAKMFGDRSASSLVSQVTNQDWVSAPSLHTWGSSRTHAVVRTSRSVFFGSLNVRSGPVRSTVRAPSVSRAMTVPLLSVTTVRPGSVNRLYVYFPSMFGTAVGPSTTEPMVLAFALVACTYTAVPTATTPTVTAMLAIHTPTRWFTSRPP